MKKLTEKEEYAILYAFAFDLYGHEGTAVIKVKNYLKARKT